RRQGPGPDRALPPHQHDALERGAAAGGHAGEPDGPDRDAPLSDGPAARRARPAEAAPGRAGRALAEARSAPRAPGRGAEGALTRSGGPPKKFGGPSEIRQRSPGAVRRGEN